MGQYDSILKQKKKIEPVINNEPLKEKHFPYVLVSVIALIIMLIISYVVYYNTILAKDVIIINNFNNIKDKYEIIVNPLYLDNFKKDNIEGTLMINDTNNYSFIKEHNNYYLKTPTINKYIDNEYVNDINININSINKIIPLNKYIKTFYFEGKTPIVEVNLILNRSELKKIFNYNFLNEYEVRITTLNNALTNEIISTKIVITDIITSARKVIIIKNNSIYYNDKSNDLRFDVNIKNKDFQIKIYKSDTLYSVLTGNEKINSYNYTYQVIDELYTLNLDTIIGDEEYMYIFDSSIEDVKESGILTINDISNELVELIEYKNLNDIDKENYNEERKYLLKFINKYKNNI